MMVCIMVTRPGRGKPVRSQDYRGPPPFPPPDSARAWSSPPAWSCRHRDAAAGPSAPCLTKRTAPQPARAGNQIKSSLGMTRQLFHFLELLPRPGPAKERGDFPTFLLAMQINYQNNRDNRGVEKKSRDKNVPCGSRHPQKSDFVSVTKGSRILVTSDGGRTIKTLLDSPSHPFASNVSAGSRSLGPEKDRPLNPGSPSKSTLSRKPITLLM